MQLLPKPIAYLTTFDAVCSHFFTGVGVVYNTKWGRYLNSSVHISYVRMTPY